MRRPRRQAGVSLAAATGSVALAFAQRPGLITADTKINLHVAPQSFLADVASMWTATGQFGGVQSGQATGYLAPMGPFFAAAHALGIADWVVQRLWLGTLLALVAWGMIRLLRAMWPQPSAPAELAAAAVAVLNPFVVTYANRTTVTLLAYAALPWLLLCVHRGVRNPRSWHWPAAIALLVTLAGGGVNGAVVAWMLVGPALLVLYEPAVGHCTWRDVRAFGLRVLPLTALVSLWWVIPAYVQSSYGNDFLRFTEQPGTVWGTTSASESLRLMGFWLSYVGIGFAGRAIPYFDDARTLLFSLPVVLASLLVPAAALTGFAWTRRWRYGPFFLALSLLAVVIMMAGYPNGTPLRHGLDFAYNRVPAVRFLRASYKAAPLLAVGLAGLSGGLWGRLADLLRARPGGRPALTGAVALTVALLAASAWPLVSGRAQDAQVSFSRVPAAWTQTATAVDRTLPVNERALVLPGELFSFYRWGGTVDPILPALARRFVAIRSEVPYADPRATDLLFTIDGLVHQQRLLPGQLRPLLSLAGVGQVITATDSDPARSDAPAPANVATQLSTQPGFAQPQSSYGPQRTFTLADRPGAPIPLPQVRRYTLPGARPLVRVEPRADPVLVDGSAAALAELAAFGALPARRPILYAGDLGSAAMRAAIRAGGDVVISDSNRRQAFVAGSLEQNTGTVLAANQDVGTTGILLDPFARGPDGETVAEFGGGIRSVTAPFEPEHAQFPEHGPYAALDGDPRTAWLADPTLDPGRRVLKVTFTTPRAVPALDLVPYGDAGGEVRAVSVNGRRFAVHPGENHLAVGLHGVSALSVGIAAVSAPGPGAVAGAGGIAELRIPGVRPTENLRLPVLAARGLAGADLAHVGLTYLFERQTGDDPFARDATHGPWSALNTADAGDAEAVLYRRFLVPARRRWRLRAWVAPAAGTPDPVLDRLAGTARGLRVTSSSRFGGRPGWRGSAALDGNRATAWIGDWGAGAAWLQITARTRLKVRRLRLVAASLAVRRPTRVRLTWGGGSAVLAVGPGGVLSLPRTIRTHTLRVTVLEALAPSGASAADRRAIGIAELTGIGGLPVPRPPRRVLATRCGAVTVRIGRRTVALRVSATAAAFAAGQPVHAISCRPAFALPAGSVTLTGVPGPWAVDMLALSSRALAPPSPAARGDAILAAGRPGQGSWSGVRLRATSPSWLVLGEGYDRGWRAWCGSVALGAPVPIDGYANGWAVGPACTHARFSFVPNRAAGLGYLISAVAAVLCLLALLLGARRGASVPVALAVHMPARPRSGTGRAVERPRSRRRWLAVLAAGTLAAFMFGPRAGAATLVVALVVVAAEVSTRVLILAAGALLGVVVPIAYLLAPGPVPGGNQYGYADARATASWVAVAALGLLAVALWRTVAARASERPGGGAIR